MMTLWSFFKNTVIIIILLLGSLALLFRASGPILENSKESIALWLSQKAGIQVDIQKVSTTWIGLSPNLILQEITLDKNKNPLPIDKIVVDLELSEFFSNNFKNILRVTVHGVNVSIEKGQKNKIKILNIEDFLSDSPVNNNIAFTNIRLRNTQIIFNDKRLNAPQIILKNIAADLKVNKNKFSINSKIKLGSGKFQIAVIGSKETNSDNWLISSYLKANISKIPNFIYDYFPKEYQFSSSKFHIELWQDWSQGLPIKSKGSFLAEKIIFDRNQIFQQTEIEKIQSDFQINRKSKNSWLVGLEKFSISNNSGLSISDRKIVFQSSEEVGNKNIQAFVDGLSLENATQLVEKTTIFQNDIKQILKKTSLKGNLKKLYFTFNFEENFWKFSSQFDTVSLKNFKSKYHIKNLNGKIKSIGNKHNILIDSKDVDLKTQDLFRDKIRISDLSGTLKVNINKNKWDIFSKKIILNTPDFQSTSSFELRSHKNKEPYLRLISQFSNGDVKNAYKYFPVSLMKEKLVSWLDDSLIDGKIEEGGLLINGPLKNFPFKNTKDGSFEVNAYTKKTSLKYKDNWPALEDIDAQIFFAQNSLDIDLINGKIKNNKIEKLKATIPSLYPTFPLEVRGEINGPLDKQLSILREGALSETFGGIANAFQVSGDSSLFLDFKVPLSSIGRPYLDGILKFKNSEVRLPKWDIRIKDVIGELKISLDSIKTKKINGKFINQPIEISISPESNETTRINSIVKLNKKSIKEKFSGIPAYLLKGESNFNFQIDIPNVNTKLDTPTLLEISSNLLGLKIDLPSPLGKLENQRKNLRVKIPFSDHNVASEVFYDKKFYMSISKNLKNIEVRYQAKKAIKKPDVDLAMLGSFDYFNLNEWQDAFSKVTPNTYLGTTWMVDLKAKKLIANEMTFNNSILKLNKKHKLLEGSIFSDEIDGIFDYKKEKKLSIKLKKLHIPYDSKDKSIGEKDQESKLNPLEFPSVYFYCMDLRVNEANFGETKFTLLPEKLGLRISELSSMGKDVKINGTGSWLWSNGFQKTKFNGLLETQRLGDLLQKLGYPRHMHKASADLSFNLFWPGNPLQGNKRNLGGDLDLSIGSGRLANVNPGITRVVGLLSVDALTRWLKFDFADLLKKGYSFDSIDGNFTFNKGYAETSNLVIDGPSSRIEVGGKIGLVKRDFDQLVSVTPKLDTTVTLASALAGGPVAGVAALLAQELLVDKVDQINRFEYSVRGTWKNPKLIPLDSGGGLSRLVNKLSGKETEQKTSEQERMLERSDSETRGPIRRLLNSLPKAKEPLKRNNQINN